MKFEVLDHGYIELVESWGSDERIIEAARMSTNKGFNGWGPHYRCRSCGCKWRNNHDDTVSLFDADQASCDVCENMTDESTCELVSGDEKLLRYLYENKHATPFEMGGLVIEVQAPIFVFREWHRHRTQSYNEMSARYTPLPDINYLPTVERLLLNSKTNKQAGTIKGAAELTPGLAEDFRASIARIYDAAEDFYQSALESGVPKELARIHLPVGRYSRMRASANLRNWLAFLTLRMAPAAQWEIRQYANAVAEIIEHKFPRTFALFRESMP